MNEILSNYGSGFELSPDGEIMALGEAGMESLLGALLPSADPKNVNARTDAAVSKFRRRLLHRWRSAGRCAERSSECAVILRISTWHVNLVPIVGC